MMLLPGSGNYGIQPVFVVDLARIDVESARGSGTTAIDMVGPEVFTYADMVKMVRDKKGSRCLVLPSHHWLTYAAGRILGLFLSDIVSTRDEIKGLSAGLLVSRSMEEPPAPTRLSDWLARHGSELGQRYASEMHRHYIGDYWHGRGPSIVSRPERSSGLSIRPSRARILLAGPPVGRVRPGNPLAVRSRGKQLQSTYLRALVRDRGVHRCVSGHFSGTCVEPRNGAGFRQSAGRPPPVGKDIPDGCTG